MKYLIVAILICVIVPAICFAEDCCGQNEIVPIETTNQEFVNESGNIVYIVTEGGMFRPYNG